MPTVDKSERDKRQQNLDKLWVEGKPGTEYWRKNKGGIGAKTKSVCVVCEKMQPIGTVAWQHAFQCTRNLSNFHPEGGFVKPEVRNKTFLEIDLCKIFQMYKAKKFLPFKKITTAHMSKLKFQLGNLEIGLCHLKYLQEAQQAYKVAYKQYSKETIQAIQCKGLYLWITELLLTINQGVESKHISLDKVEYTVPLPVKKKAPSNERNQKWNKLLQDLGFIGKYKLTMAGGAIEEDIIDVNTLLDNFKDVKAVIDFIITLLTKFEDVKVKAEFIPLTDGLAVVPEYTSFCQNILDSLFSITDLKSLQDIDSLYQTLSDLINNQKGMTTDQKAVCHSVSLLLQQVQREAKKNIDAMSQKVGNKMVTKGKFMFTFGPARDHFFGQYIGQVYHDQETTIGQPMFSKYFNEYYKALEIAQNQSIDPNTYTATERYKLIQEKFDDQQASRISGKQYFCLAEIYLWHSNNFFQCDICKGVFVCSQAIQHFPNQHPQMFGFGNLTSLYSVIRFLNADTTADYNLIRIEPVPNKEYSVLAQKGQWNTQHTSLKDILKYKGQKDVELFRYLTSLKRFLDPLEEVDEQSSHDLSSSSRSTRTRTIHSSAKTISATTLAHYKNQLKPILKHLRDFDHMTALGSGWSRPNYEEDQIDDYFAFLSQYSSGKVKDRDIATCAEFVEKVLDNLFVCPSVLGYIYFDCDRTLPQLFQSSKEQGLKNHWSKLRITHDYMLKFFDTVNKRTLQGNLKRIIAYMMLALLLDAGLAQQKEKPQFIFLARNILEVTSSQYLNITPSELGAQPDTKDFLIVCHQFCQQYLQMPLIIVDLVFSKWSDFSCTKELHQQCFGRNIPQDAKEFWKDQISNYVSYVMTMQVNKIAKQEYMFLVGEISLSEKDAAIVFFNFLNNYINKRKRNLELCESVKFKDFWQSLLAIHLDLIPGLTIRLQSSPPESWIKVVNEVPRIPNGENLHDPDFETIRDDLLGQLFSKEQIKDEKETPEWKLCQEHYKYVFHEEEHRNQFYPQRWKLLEIPNNRQRAIVFVTVYLTTRPVPQIGEHWKCRVNNRVLLDCGTGTGKSLIEQCLWLLFSRYYSNNGRLKPWGTFFFSNYVLMQRDIDRYLRSQAALPDLGYLQFRSKEMLVLNEGDNTEVNQLNQKKWKVDAAFVENPLADLTVSIWDEWDSMVWDSVEHVKRFDTYIKFLHRRKENLVVLTATPTFSEESCEEQMYLIKKWWQFQYVKFNDDKVQRTVVLLSNLVDDEKGIRLQIDQYRGDGPLLLWATSPFGKQCVVKWLKDQEALAPINQPFVDVKDCVENYQKLQNEVTHTVGTNEFEGYKVLVLDETHLRGTDFHIQNVNVNINVLVIGYVQDYGEMNQLHGRCTRSNKLGKVYVVAPDQYDHPKLLRRAAELNVCIQELQAAGQGTTSADNLQNGRLALEDKKDSAQAKKPDKDIEEMDF